MDDLPDEPPGRFNPRHILRRKAPGLSLKLLLLLGNVVHNQSLRPCCPNRTAVVWFGNFTSRAGSSFFSFLKIPIRAPTGQTRHHRLSLADEEGPLPHWMVFRHQRSGLVGLGLGEDCGTYRLKVCVVGGQCGHAALLYLHILDKTVNNKDPQSPTERDVLTSSIWSKLLLQMNPESLNASQWIFLINALTNFLHLPPRFVYQFSRNRSFLLQRERLRVCSRGGLAEKLAREKQDVRREVGELVWPVGCQGEERQPDWAKTLGYSTNLGSLKRLLGAPVLGWRLLCAAGGAQHKVKRDLQRQKHTPTPNRVVSPPTHNHGPRILAASVQVNHLGTKLSPAFTQNLINTIISVGKEFPLNSSGTPRDAFSDSSLEAVVLAPDWVASTEEKPSSALSSVKTIPYIERTYTSGEQLMCTDETLRTGLHTLNCVEFACRHRNGFASFPLHDSEEQTGSSLQTLVAVTRCNEQILRPNAETPLLPTLNSRPPLIFEATSAVFHGEYIWTSELAHVNGDALGRTKKTRSAIHSKYGTHSRTDEFVESERHLVSLLSMKQDLENLSPFWPEHTSTVRNFVHTAFVQEMLTGTGLSLPSAGPQSVRPPLPLNPAPSSVTSTLTHATVDRESVVTCLTPQPCGKETPLPTGPCRAPCTESDRQSAVSSAGVICSPVPAPSEESNNARLPNSRLNVIRSPPSTQPFPDVPPPVLMTEQLSVTRQYATIQYPSPAPSSSSSFPSAPHQTASRQSLLSASLLHTLEPSMTRFTEALPSELGFFSGQLETPRTSPPLFSVETLEASSFPAQPLQTLSSSSLPNTSASSLQQDVDRQVATGLQSKSEAVSGTDQNGPTRTLSTGNVFVTPLQTHPARPLQMHLPSTQIISAALTVLGGSQGAQEKTTESRALSSGSKDTPAHVTVQLNPSVQQTAPQTTMIKESQEIICIPLMPSKNKKTSVAQTKSEQYTPIAFLPGMTTRTHFNTEFLITIRPGLTPVSLTALESLAPVDGGHFEPIAPSTAQQPCTASPTPEMQSLEPSFPSCSSSAVQDQAGGSDHTPPLNSTQPENTREHVLDFSTSSFTFEPLGNESYWTASSSRFIKYESREQFLSTNGEAGVETSLQPTGLFSDFLGETKGFTSLLWVSGIDLTTPMTPGPSDFVHLLNSSSSPLIGSGFSSMSGGTSVLSGNGLSCLSTDTDSGSFITVCPLMGHQSQILSIYLSQYHGVLSTLTTSHATLLRPSSRGQSSVQLSHPSTSTPSLMNLPPKVLQSIPALTATVGFPFHYAIPPKTFLDPEDGEADALSLEMRLIDGPPLSMGSWLTLDGLELHGVPLEADLQFAPQHLLLAARDSQGLSAWLPLTLDLRRSPVDPCHLFTLTSHLSLHSILRHRRRVELLLGKLSRFFNSSGDHHLSIVSMSPGSTVVSWYNCSLCETGRSRVRQCHVGQIRSMWLAMGSDDGRVNPAFRKAMLPEFPIAEVGPVSYRQDCFTSSLTPTLTGFSLGTDNSNPNPSPSSVATVFAPTTTTATARPENSYRWMAGMLAALLIVCLLILIVVLVSAVLYFRRGHRRTRTVAIWPAGRMLPAHDTDRRAVRPRLPPLFQQELPPPPLELWINLTERDEWPMPSTRVQGNI